jgi:hypothetical protein
MCSGKPVKPAKASCAKLDEMIKTSGARQEYLTAKNTSHTKKPNSFNSELTVDFSARSTALVFSCGSVFRG